MVTERTEEEQVEAIKKWLEENGTSLLVSIVVVLAGVFGYQTWETQKQEAIDAASNIYDELSQVVVVGPFDTLSDEDKSTAMFLADQLKTDYPDSTYADFAALHLAKLAVDAEDLGTAEAELQWILDGGADEKITPIVKLRLARIYLAKEDYAAAHKTLDSIRDTARGMAFEEIRGDIYVAEGDTDMARTAYEAAIDKADGLPTAVVEMKLNDLVMPGIEIASEEGE